MKKGRNQSKGKEIGWEREEIRAKGKKWGGKGKKSDVVGY